MNAANWGICAPPASIVGWPSMSLCAPGRRQRVREYHAESQHILPASATHGRVASAMQRAALGHGADGADWQQGLRSTWRAAQNRR
jgi:hypothetical protein